MPDIATALKAEISRISRKEVRAETEALKKALTAYRTEIAALKRRAKSLEDGLRQIGKTSAKAKVATPQQDVVPTSATAAGRFSAKALAAQRKRLQLSAERIALLLGVSGQSVYNWEQGSTVPHAKHLTAISALKDLTVTQAKELVESRRH
jgi:DNA-binding transcriptional regulator YiaG